MNHLHIKSGWHYRTAAETQKEGYLRRRFAQIRAEQKSEALQAANVRPIRQKRNSG